MVPGSFGCGSAVLAATTTLAPSLAALSAMALPIPRLAPDMYITLPASFLFIKREKSYLFLCKEVFLRCLSILLAHFLFPKVYLRFWLGMQSIICYCLNLRHHKSKTNNVMKEFWPDMAFSFFDVIMETTSYSLSKSNIYLTIEW